MTGSLCNSCSRGGAGVGGWGGGGGVGGGGVVEGRVCGGDWRREGENKGA